MVSGNSAGTCSGRDGVGIRATTYRKSKPMSLEGRMLSRDIFVIDASTSTPGTSARRSVVSVRGSGGHRGLGVSFPFLGQSAIRLFS